MDLNTIKQILEGAFPEAEIEVKGDGYHHEVIIISPTFENQSLVARQQRVYKLFTKQIESGELHALSIKAKTPAELQS